MVSVINIILRAERNSYRKYSRRTLMELPNLSFEEPKLLNGNGHNMNILVIHKLLKCLTAKLLQQGYRYHKLRKTFSKFYRRQYELISKYNVGLKTLLSEGLSEPEFYGDLVYKFKKLKGINDFSFQFRKIITRYRRIGYNLNVMRQSACLVFNPIMVDNYAAFFNCTPVGRASDSMMAPT